MQSMGGAQTLTCTVFAQGPILSMNTIWISLFHAQANSLQRLHFVQNKAITPCMVSIQPCNSMLWQKKQSTPTTWNFKRKTFRLPYRPPVHNEANQLEDSRLIGLNVNKAQFKKRKANCLSSKYLIGQCTSFFLSCFIPTVHRTLNFNSMLWRIVEQTR